MNGVEREIDNNGRVVIPMEFRKALGIKFNSRVLIFLSNGEIVIRAKKTRCALCGGNIDGERTLHICDSCVEMVKKEL